MTGTRSRDAYMRVFTLRAVLLEAHQEGRLSSASGIDVDQPWRDANRHLLAAEEALADIQEVQGSGQREADAGSLELEQDGGW